jgi:hypothetical protein
MRPDSINDHQFNLGRGFLFLWHGAPPALLLLHPKASVYLIIVRCPIARAGGQR